LIDNKEQIMATTMNRHSHMITTRTVTQKVCIVLGIFFVIAGLGGIVMPGMLGMHLSLLHNIVHLASGALALWCGYSDDSKKAYMFSVAFGSVYSLLGIAGFVFGSPGYPGVGHMEADENLLRVIPNAFELGTADHVVHILAGAAFLVGAYVWKNRNDVTGRTIVNEQGRNYRDRSTLSTRQGSSSDVFRKNSESNLKDANLGRSDISRPIDKGRRSDFERRV
jgi:hypothetical protein